MVAKTPADDLNTVLAAQITALTVGTNLFSSTIRAPDGFIPVDCVFTWSGGELEPQRTMSDPDAIRRAVIQVRVRDGKFGDGSDLIYEIAASLIGVDISGYLDATLGSPGPRAMGQDTDGRHLFGAEFILIWIETNP